jgi:hypothetical protein
VRLKLTYLNTVRPAIEMLITAGFLSVRCWSRLRISKPRASASLEVKDEKWMVSSCLRMIGRSAFAFSSAVPADMFVRVEGLLR